MALTDFFEPFCKMNCSYQQDMYGGETRVYTDAESFMAGLTMPPARSERTDAEKLSTIEKYTLFLPLGINLKHGDKVKQMKTGRIFRICSFLYETPAFACTHYAIADCEVVTV